MSHDAFKSVFGQKRYRNEKENLAQKKGEINKDSQLENLSPVGRKTEFEKWLENGTLLIYNNKQF